MTTVQIDYSDFDALIVSASPEARVPPREPSNRLPDPRTTTHMHPDDILEMGWSDQKELADYLCYADVNVDCNRIRAIYESVRSVFFIGEVAYSRITLRSFVPNPDDRPLPKPKRKKPKRLPELDGNLFAVLKDLNHE